MKGRQGAPRSILHLAHHTIHRALHLPGVFMPKHLYGTPSSPAWAFTSIVVVTHLVTLAFTILLPADSLPPMLTLTLSRTFFLPPRPLSFATRVCGFFIALPRFMRASSLDQTYNVPSQVAVPPSQSFARPVQLSTSIYTT